MQKLTIPQALFLLARDNATGKPLGNYNSYIQPAGALTELVMMGHLALRPGRKAVLDVVSTAPTGSEYLDTLLMSMAASKRAHGMQHWVSKFSCKRGRIRMIGEELVAKGIVEEVPAKYFGLFPVTRWAVRRQGPKLKLHADMSKVLFTENSRPDDWTGAVIALANAGHLLKRNFDRNKLSMHKDHIKQVVKDEQLGANAAKAAVKAIQAVIIISSAAAVSAIG